MSTRLAFLELRADMEVKSAMLKCASVADAVSELVDTEGARTPTIDTDAVKDSIAQARTQARTNARALGEAIGKADRLPDKSMLSKLMIAAPAVLGAATGDKPLAGAMRGLGTGAGMLAGYAGGQRLGDILAATRFMQHASPGLRTGVKLLSTAGGTALGGSIGYKVMKALI